MIIYKCQNEDCSFYPCFLRCDKCADDECIIKPEGCPHLAEEPKWKLLPFTKVNFGLIDTLDEWEGGEGYNKIPKEVKEIIEGLFIYNSWMGRDASSIAQAQGMLREYERSYYQDEEIRNKIKKTDRIELLGAVFMSAFRAGMIYDNYLRIEGKADFTIFDEE